MLPVFRRFAAADYPTAPSWLGGMFASLNVFCETVVQTLTKNLVIGQNVQGMKYTTSFTTLSDYATGGFTPITFTYTGGGIPDCCIIGSINKTSGAAVYTGAVITWTINKNVNPPTITINYIHGLEVTSTYNITFLVV
jgi:hypothetical protein